MKLKSYKAIGYPYYTTTFVVNDKEVLIVFNGSGNRFGTFQTKDVDLQEEMEKSASFNKTFVLDWEHDSEIEIEVTKQEIHLKVGNNEVTINQNPEGFTEVTGVNNFNTAKKWMVDNKDVTTDQVKNKTDLLHKCEEFKIKFIDLK